MTDPILRAIEPLTDPPAFSTAPSLRENSASLRVAASSSHEATPAHNAVVLDMFSGPDDEHADAGGEVFTKFHTIVEHALDGIILLDGHGVIQYANDAACTLFARSSENIVGRSLGLPVTPEGPTELEVVRRDGSDVVTFLELRAIESDWNGQPALLAWLRDVTSQRSAELELIRMNAELSQSIADLEAAATFVAHDLAQPIASVTQCVSTLKALVGHDGAESLEMLDLAEQGLGAMREFVTALLEPGHAGSGTVTLAEVNCTRLVEQCRTVVAHVSGTVAIGPLPTVRADELLLRQIFQNLILNGLTHNRPRDDARVEVSAQETEEGWRFSVIDNGPGIPVPIRDRIFDAFWRPPSDQPGSGLGLAVCRRAVNRLGGRIWIEDDATEGTHFCFTVPSSPALL